jgi:hypothetical protein
MAARLALLDLVVLVLVLEARTDVEAHVAQAVRTGFVHCPVSADG